jgi:hypothetical protein
MANNIKRGHVMKKMYLIVCFGLIFFGAAGIYADYKLTDNILGNIVGGCGRGPCLYIFGTPCGYGPGPTNCAYNMDEGRCNPTVCPDYCPLGENHAWCKKLFGSCNLDPWGLCSYVMHRECRMYGFPSRCACAEITTGIQCPRTICR